MFLKAIIKKTAIKASYPSVVIQKAIRTNKQVKENSATKQHPTSYQLQNHTESHNFG